MKIALGLAAVVALGAGGLHLYEVHGRHRLGTVSEGQLYKSAAMPPRTMASVAKELGLRTVIDLRTSTEGQDSTNTTAQDAIDAEAAALRAAGVRHVHLPTGQVPTDETVRRFLEVLDDPASRPALVHCHHGVGRAELFAALYRIEFEGWSNAKARDATRWIVAGSSFSDGAEKGRFLLQYQPRRKASGASPR